jgi:hypothetical protein
MLFEIFSPKFLQQKLAFFAQAAASFLHIFNHDIGV